MPMPGETDGRFSLRNPEQLTARVTYGWENSDNWPAYACTSTRASGSEYPAGHPPRSPSIRHAAAQFCYTRITPAAAVLLWAEEKHWLMA